MLSVMLANQVFARKLALVVLISKTKEVVFPAMTGRDGFPSTMELATLIGRLLAIGSV